jgi:Barstar (barnase inhibitor)
MATERTLPMQIVELHADGWATAVDVVNALKKAIGAPDWHGASPDAFLDSMIYHDDINALKPPYTLRISGTDRAKPEARNFARLLARLIHEAGASDRGGDLEVTMLVED